jgi:pyruvyl transferase EpsO
MDLLKARLAGLRSYLPTAKPVAYLDYPLHLNIGDLLIRRGTEQFFSDFGYDVALRWPAFALTPAHLRKIGPDTTIVMHGGGNFGDIYYSHQTFREWVVERFPDNKIVVLPQTVHFDCERNISQAAEVFNRHRDITVFVRDRRSKSILDERFECPVVVAPDMAHQLWRVLNANDAGRGTLYMLRVDIEKTPKSARWPSAGRSIDWDDLVSTRRYVMWRLTRYLHSWESTSGLRLLGPQIWALQNEWLIGHAVRVVSRYEALVTDRLHACILGSLLGKKVSFIDNSYGKLGSYYETWLTEVQGIAPADAQ